LAEDYHAYYLKLWNLLTALLPKFPPGHRSHGRLNAGSAKQTFLVSKLRQLLQGFCLIVFIWDELF
jgi:hypothetical protein